MTKAYINTGFAPGASEYTDTTDAVHVGRVSFSARATNVRVDKTNVRMVADTITVVSPFGVMSCDDSCEVGQLNESIKVQINVRYGSNNTITSMRAELNRLLDIWQANNMAYGVVPPIGTDINDD